VLAVFLFFRNEFDSLLDGIVYGGITALGFAATENVLYLFGAYGENVGQAHANNDLLQALATTGLAGLAAYAWLLLAAWRRLRNALRDETRRADAAAAGAGLAAAFVVAKFNPVPLDGLALAALLLGLLDPGGERSRALSRAAAGFRRRRPRLTWLRGRPPRARGCAGRGPGEEARVAYAAAARVNPAEQRYGLCLPACCANRRARGAGSCPPPGPGRGGGGGARDGAAESLDSALHALGGSLASLSLQGGPDAMAEAAAVLERGARADWSYRPLLETRLTVANLRRDARAKAGAEAQLARLDAARR
jgi:hypothetical protein